MSSDEFDEKLLKINANEALPMFIMIFLVFFQIGNLSVSSTELIFKFMSAVLSLLGASYQFPLKLSTIKRRIKADFAINGTIIFILFYFFILFFIYVFCSCIIYFIQMQ